MSKFLTFILVFFTASVWAQNYSAYPIMRDGIKAYDQQMFDTASVDFGDAAQLDSANAIHYFNMGDAAYKLGAMDKASQHFKTATTLAKDPNLLSDAYMNWGNALFGKNQYQEAIEMYKDALRKNPANDDARYNLTLAKKKLKEQEEQQNQDQDQNQDQNQQNEDQQNQDQQNQDQQNQDQQNQDQQNQDQQNQDQQNQDQQNQDQQNQDQQNQDQQNQDQQDQDQQNQDQQNQDQQNQDQQNQDQEQEGNQNPENQEGKPENEEGEQPDAQDPAQEGQNQPGQAQPAQAGELSKEDAERILNALKNKEKETQEKILLQKSKGKKTKSDKDW